MASRDRLRWSPLKTSSRWGIRAAGQLPNEDRGGGRYVGELVVDSVLQGERGERPAIGAELAHLAGWRLGALSIPHGLGSNSPSRSCTGHSTYRGGRFGLGSVAALKAYRATG